jgi:hypothetical protein
MSGSDNHQIEISRHVDLHLARSQVDDALLLALSSSSSTARSSTPPQAPVPRLRLVSVAMCPLVTDAGVMALAGAHPHLEALRVDHCGRVSERSVAAAGVRCISD